jgi:hypothetical protein
MKRINIEDIKKELPRAKARQKGGKIAAFAVVIDVIMVEGKRIAASRQGKSRCRFIGAAPPSISQGEMAGQKQPWPKNMQSGGGSINDGRCFPLLLFR